MSSAGAAHDEFQQALLPVHKHQQRHQQRQQPHPYAQLQQTDNPLPWAGGSPHDFLPEQRRKTQQHQAEHQHLLLLQRQLQVEHEQEQQPLQKPKTPTPGLHAPRPLKAGGALTPGGPLATAVTTDTLEEQPRVSTKTLSLSSGVSTTSSVLQRRQQQQQQKQQPRQRRRALRRMHLSQLSPAKKQLECPSGKTRAKPAAAAASCSKHQRPQQPAAAPGAPGLQWFKAPSFECLADDASAAEHQQKQQQPQQLLLRQLPARLALLQHQRQQKQQQQQQQQKQQLEQRASQQQQLQDFLQLQPRRQQQQQQQHQHVATLPYSTLRRKPPTRWKKPSPFGLRVDFPVNPLLQPLLLDNNPFLDSRPTYKGSTRLYEVHIQRKGGELLSDEHLQLQLGQKQQPVMLQQEQQQLLLQQEQRQSQIANDSLFSGVKSSSSSCDVLGAFQKEAPGQLLLAPQPSTGSSSSSSGTKSYSCRSLDCGSSSLQQHCSRHGGSSSLQPHCSMDSCTSRDTLQQSEEAAHMLAAVHSSRSCVSQQQQQQEQQQQQQSLQLQEGGLPLACCCTQEAQPNERARLQQQQRPQQAGMQQQMPRHPLLQCTDTLLHPHREASAAAAVAAVAAVAGSVLSPVSCEACAGVSAASNCSKRGSLADCEDSCKSSCCSHPSAAKQHNSKGASLLELLQEPQSLVEQSFCCSSCNCCSNYCSHLSSSGPDGTRGSNGSSPLRVVPMEQQQQLLLQQHNVMQQTDSALSQQTQPPQQQQQQEALLRRWEQQSVSQQQQHQQQQHQQQQQQWQGQQVPKLFSEEWVQLKNGDLFALSGSSAAAAAAGHCGWASDMCCCCRDTTPVEAISTASTFSFNKWENRGGSKSCRNSSNCSSSNCSNSSSNCCCKRGKAGMSSLKSMPAALCTEQFFNWSGATKTEETERFSAGVSVAAAAATTAATAAVATAATAAVAAASPSRSKRSLSVEAKEGQSPARRETEGSEAGSAAAALSAPATPVSVSAAAPASGAAAAATPSFWRWPGALLLGGLSLMPLAGAAPAAAKAESGSTAAAAPLIAAADGGGVSEGSKAVKTMPTVADASLSDTSNKLSQQLNGCTDTAAFSDSSLPQQEEQREEQQRGPLLSLVCVMQQEEAHHRPSPAVSDERDTKQQQQLQPRGGDQHWQTHEECNEQRQHEQQEQLQQQEKEQREGHFTLHECVMGALEMSLQDALSNLNGDIRSSSWEVAAGGWQEQPRGNMLEETSGGDQLQQLPVHLPLSAETETKDPSPRKRRVGVEGLLLADVTACDGCGLMIAAKDSERKTSRATAELEVPQLELKPRRYSVVELLLCRGSAAAATAPVPEGRELMLPGQELGTTDTAAKGAFASNSVGCLRFVLQTPRANKPAAAAGSHSAPAAAVAPRAHGVHQPAMDLLLHQRARRHFAGGGVQQRRRSEMLPVGISSISHLRQQKELLAVSALRRTSGMKIGQATAPKRPAAAATEGRGAIAGHGMHGENPAKQRQAKEHLQGKRETAATKLKSCVAQQRQAEASFSLLGKQLLWTSDPQRPCEPLNAKGDMWGFCTSPQEPKKTDVASRQKVTEMPQQQQQQQQMEYDSLCVAPCFSGLSDSAVLLWRAAAMRGDISEEFPASGFLQREEALPLTHATTAASDCHSGPQALPASCGPSADEDGLPSAIGTTLIRQENARKTKKNLDDGCMSIGSVCPRQQPLPFDLLQAKDAVQPPAKSSGGLAREYIDFLSSTSIIEASLVSPHPPSPTPPAPPPCFEPAAAALSPEAPIEDGLFRLVF